MYRRILLVVDLGEQCERIGERARDIASLTGAELSVLHVVEYVPVGIAAARREVAAGNIKAEIVRAAQEQHADLIVLGCRERRGPSILVNFTEDTVLHAAPCDVLAVRLR